MSTHLLTERGIIMRLSKFLQTRTLTELEAIKTELNLTEDEARIFEYLRKGKSNIQIADLCCCSLATVGNRIKDINTKMERINIEG